MFHLFPLTQYKNDLSIDHIILENIENECIFKGSVHTELKIIRTN